MARRKKASRRMIQREQYVERRIRDMDKKQRKDMRQEKKGRGMKEEMRKENGVRERRENHLLLDIQEALLETSHRSS